jgi:hypothetical protein
MAKVRHTENETVSETPTEPEKESDGQAHILKYAYGIRHPNTLAREYLVDFDMLLAMRRAGYKPGPTPSMERKRSERMWYSKRFQLALRQEWARLRLQVLGRIARGGDTNAALRAVDQLDNLLTQDMGKTADGSRWSE